MTLTPGTPPRIVGRPPNDYAQELQDFLDGLAAVHAATFATSAEPQELVLNQDGDAGSSNAPALEDHIHALNLGLAGKGDLLVFDGSEYAALPVGSDGDVLTADSGEPTGLKYDAAGGGGGAGMLELVENHDFAAPATSHTFSGLDGDTDEIYLLKYRIVKGVAAAINVDLQPNGVTANRTTYLDYIGSGGAGSTNLTDWHISGNASGGTGGVEAGEVWLDVKSGVRRTGLGQWATSDGAGVAHQMVRSIVDWTDTAANITSLVILCDQANGIGAGSYARLYKLNKA